MIAHAPVSIDTEALPAADHRHLAYWRRSVYIAAGLSWVAAAIHSWEITAHFAHWWGIGALFLFAAVFQGFYSGVLVYWSHPWVLFAGMVFNAAAVGFYVLTRTVWSPYYSSGHIGVPDGVGVLDLVATAAEAGIVITLLGLWVQLRLRRLL